MRLRVFVSLGMLALGCGNETSTPNNERSTAAKASPTAEASSPAPAGAPPRTADPWTALGGDDTKAARDAAATLATTGEDDDRLSAALSTRAVARTESWTLSALADLGPRAAPAFDAIVPLLTAKPDDAQFGPQVGRTLWALGGAAAVTKAYEDSEDRDTREGLLRAASDALSGAQGSQADVDAVLPMMQTAMATSKLRMPAILALGELGPRAASAAPAMGRLLRVANPDTRAQLAYALAAIGAEAAVDDLLAVIDEEDTQFRYAAARALGCVRNETIVGKLNRALQRPEDAAKINAASALSYQDERAAPALSMLMGLLVADNEELQVAAAEAIGAIGPEASKAKSALQAGLSGAGLEVEVSFKLALSQIAGTAVRDGVPRCPGG